MDFDKLIYANILTMDREYPVFQAVGIKNGKIAFLGMEQEANTLEAKMILDYKGKTVLPGFIDTHVHAFPSAIMMTGVDLSSCTKIEEVTASLADYCRRVPVGAWVFGSHFQDKLLAENRFPALAELDAVSAEHPIILIHNDLHPVMFNSQAIKLLHLDSRPGLLLTDTEGNFIGIVKDTYCLQVMSELVETFPDEAVLDAFKKLERHALKNGTTTICIKESKAILKLLIENREQFKVCLKPMLIYNEDKDIDEILGHPLLKDETCICVFADGSFDAYNAALFEPFDNDLGNFGVLNRSNQELYAIYKKVHDNGLQFSCHAIGDRAIQQVLDVTEQVLKENSRTDHRHRIEHFEMPTQGQINKAAQLGLALAMQPLLLEVCEGMDMEGYRPYVGDRVVRCSPYRSLLDANALIGAGSDFMVTDMLPLRAAQVLMSHPVPEQRIDLHECLEMYTGEAAKVAFLENKKGTIKLGMDADLVVIDGDPYQTAIDKLSTIKVEMTIYNGEMVYSV